MKNYIVIYILSIVSLLVVTACNISGKREVRENITTMSRHHIKLSLDRMSFMKIR